MTKTCLENIRNFPKDFLKKGRLIWRMYLHFVVFNKSTSQYIQNNFKGFSFMTIFNIFYVSVVDEDCEIDTFSVIIKKMIFSNLTQKMYFFPTT